MDNKSIVKDKNVLDFGSGCGACGLISVMNKAKSVNFNDIDLDALEAIRLNGLLNNIKIDILSSQNLIGSDCEDIDVVLVGDMLYDSEFANDVLTWLQDLVQRGKRVFIGDPGRFALDSHPLKESLNCIGKYRLRKTAMLENNGHVDGYVWTF